MNFSFAGCGFLGIYHVGVASCLKQHAPHLVEGRQLAGASAGAIVACCLMCGCCVGDCTTFTLRLATKARSTSLGPLHPSFKISKIIRDALWIFLPENAHEICTGRLFVSLTRVVDRKNVVVSNFASKEELIQALLCSAHVPFYSGLVPPTFRGVRYVDGGLSDNIPVINDETVSVSPFAGECDICPNDGSPNTQYIYLANTSMQCGMANVYRLTRALFPPHLEILSDMCQQGFDDCLKFLQNNNLISCVRHLSVKSVMIPVPVSPDDSEESAEEEDPHHHGDAGDCPECKRKLQVALVDKLPHVVGTVLQEACDAANKGISAYIHRHAPLRWLSFIATPWVLPAEIVASYGLRFLKYLPRLPKDVRCLYRETTDLLQYLVTNIHHSRRRYTARFTCHLAITEVNYNNIETDIFPHEPLQHTSHQVQSKNMNFEFEVDFDTTIATDQAETHVDHLNVQRVNHQRQRSNSYYQQGSSPSHLPTGKWNSVEQMLNQNDNSSSNSQLFDTFEQCLHVSNQMESIMAYHYQDSDHKCYKFSEIYSISDLQMVAQAAKDSGSLPNVPTTPLADRPRARSLSLGSILTHKQSHLEWDLEQFVGKHSGVILKDHQLEAS